MVTEAEELERLWKREEAAAELLEWWYNVAGNVVGVPKQETIDWLADLKPRPNHEEATPTAPRCQQRADGQDRALLEHALIMLREVDTTAARLRAQLQQVLNAVMLALERRHQ